MTLGTLKFARSFGLAMILASSVSSASAATEDIYLSATSQGRAGEVFFQDEDIVHCDRSSGPGSCVWQMYFDGSAAGLTEGTDVTAFHLLDESNILMSFGDVQLINNVGDVHGSDIVNFDAGSDPSTAFTLFFDGSDVGLSTVDEAIDAIGVTPTGGGRLVVSVGGNYSVPKTGGGTLTGGDEDLIVFNGTTGLNTSGSWELFMDGSGVGLTMPQEDVWSSWIDNNSGEVYLSVKEQYRVGFMRGLSFEVFICNPRRIDPIDSCYHSGKFFKGSLEDYKAEVIDGLFIVNNSPPTDIALDNNSVDENQPAGTAVGTLTTVDPDPLDTHTYSLEAGSGDTDNASFAIVGDQLQTAAVLNFEAMDSCTTSNSTCSIRIQTDDGNGGTYQESFIIDIGDLNDDPTDISLDSQDVDENEPAGTAVGTLATNDEDTADIHTYTLVAGAGDTDNTQFTIVGDELQTNAVLNFEAADNCTTSASTCSIRVETDDGNGGLFERTFIISINDVNDDPTDIALDNTSVDENQPSGTAVGTFTSTDEDPTDTHSYTLVAGAGDTDNAQFKTVGDELQTNAVLNFEAADNCTTSVNTCSVRIQTDDGNGGTYQETFIINIGDVNDDPSDIALDSSDVDENEPSGTAVGNFSTVDEDPADTHTYTLVAGTGGTDNGSFSIVGDQLQTAAVFDYDTQDSFSIRVQTDDGNGGMFEEVFTITVNQVNTAPTDIALDNASVNENQPGGTTVGTFTTTDGNASDTHTYTLVAGAGDTDNSAFATFGDQLQTAAVLNFEAMDNCLTSVNTCSIRVKTDDGNGGQFEKSFIINIGDINDAPTDIALDNSDVVENQAIGTLVGNFSTTDEDATDTHTYTLVAGAGDTGNASFSISGGQLLTAAVFDESAQNSYSVRVRTDDGSATYEEVFTINITPENAAPMIITTATPMAAENQTAVIDIETTDDFDSEGSGLTYGKTGGADAALFSLNTVNGTLSFMSAPDFENPTDVGGTAGDNIYLVQVTVTDSGPGGNLTDVQDLMVSVTNVNEAPVAVQDDYTGAIGNTRFELVAALGPTPIPPTVQLVGTIVSNDTDVDVGDTLTVTANASIATTQGGSVALDANGRFVYSPPAGFPGSGASADQFSYQLCDDGAPVLCDTGTVTIEGTNMVWYVDDSSPNNPGTGTAGDPFRDLSSAGGPSLAGETIFVYAGTQTTGITLKNNQPLLGEGLVLVVNTITLVDAGTRPVIANAGSAAITLGSDNTVRGLDISGSQQGIVGTGFGTLTADNIAISTTGGPGIDLTNGAGSVTFDSLSSSASSGSGIDLDSVSGSFSFGGGSISGSGGAGINITSSTATVSYGGTITAGSDLAVNVGSHTANSVSLSGNITSSGQGILLNNNTGGTINLSGGMLLSTGAFTAFSATNGGTVNVTGTNTVTTSTATAVAIVDTTIGGSNVTFESITSTGSSANAGIILDDTGSGTFTVSGTGGMCTSGVPTCTGGTISNKTDTAVTFNNTDGRITFNDMLIQDIGSMAGGFNTRSGHDGIHGQDVNGGLTLDNVLIQRISDNCVNGSLFSNGITESFWDGLEILNSTIQLCNRFHVAGVADTQDEGGVRIAGITGTVTIDNNTFNLTGEHLDFFTHSSGTLDMDVTNNFFIDAYQEYNPPVTVTSVGGMCVDVTVEGSSDANVTIGGAGNSNDFENCGIASVRVTKDTVPAGSSNVDFIVDNNTFRVTDQTDAAGTFGNTPQGGVLLRAGPGDITTFDGIVSNNTFGIAIGPDDRIGSTGEEVANADGVGGNVVLIFDSGVSQARVNNNAFNGSINAPWVNRADGNTSAAVLYQDNSYRGRDDYCCDSGFTFTVPGIPYRTQSRNGGSLDITFVNDQMVHHDQFFFAGTETLEFLTRNDTGFAGGTMCMAFHNAASGDGYEFRETSGTLELYQGATNNAATGPCTVGATSDCQNELADDGVRGGPTGYTQAGAPNAALNPPFVDVDSGSINIVGTACTVPGGGIFSP